MNYHHPELQQRLAGEYVLGTLQGPARRRFERLLAADLALRQYVQAWERRLSPWLYAVPPEAVPDRVWTRIQERLGQRPASPPRPAFAPWKWLGLGSTAVAATLALFLVLRPAPPAPTALTDVAVLSTDKAEPVWIVRRDGQDILEFSGLSAVDVPGDRDLELWAIPDGGAPQSLGVLRRTDATHARVTLSATAQARLAGGKLLAISLEPTGGSPTGAPTGPVLFTGRLQG
ncbi:MAG: anti-sigma factor [Pseudomonadota bacterium]